MTLPKTQIVSAKLQLVHNTIKAKKINLLDSVKARLVQLNGKK